MAKARQPIVRRKVLTLEIDTIHPNSAFKVPSLNLLLQRENGEKSDIGIIIRQASINSVKKEV